VEKKARVSFILEVGIFVIISNFIRKKLYKNCPRVVDLN
jgi:hypothetical protein